MKSKDTTLCIDVQCSFSKTESDSVYEEKKMQLI